MKLHVFSSALSAMLLACGGSAWAQSAGALLVKIGANTIAPQVTSGDLSAPAIPGTKIDVKSASSVVFTATYMLTDVWSLEFYAGLPYEHEVVGDGTIKGVGKLGTVKQISPTLFGQYRFFEADSAFRPYVGLGLTYAYFYGEKGSGTLTALTNAGGAPTRMSSSAAFGLSPEIGATYRFDEHWFVDAAVVKTYLKNKTTLSTGQTISTKLDPLSTNISVGYRF